MHINKDTTRGKAVREFDAIFKDERQSAGEKIEAALRFNPSGRPGAREVRMRQERILGRRDGRHAPGLTGGDNARRRRGPVVPDSRVEKSGDAAFACRLGESYHLHVGRLYVSSRGSVSYGRGGQDRVDYDAYSKSYGHPARWKDAGARVEYAPHPKNRGRGTVILETSRGREAARLPLPTRRERANLTFRGLLDGDLYAVRRRAGAGRELLVRYRWDARRGSFRRTGYAMLILKEESPTGEAYYEHGRTVEEMRAAVRQKWEARSRSRREAEEAMERAARDAAGALKAARMAALVARLCQNLVVTVDDCKKLGYCDAGIAAFRKRHDLGTAATARELRATKDATAARAIGVAVRRVVTERLSNGR